MAGPRALAVLFDSSLHLTTASTHLGCSRPEVADRVKQRETQRKEIVRLAGRVKDRLAAIEGRQIKWIESQDGVWRGVGEFDDEAVHDYEFLQSVASSATERLKEMNSTSGQTPPPFVLVLVSIPSTTWLNKAHLATGSLVLITSSPENPTLGKTVMDHLKSGLDGSRVKGGGAKGRFMAKVTGGWGDEERRTGLKGFEGCF